MRKLIVLLSMMLVLCSFAYAIPFNQTSCSLNPADYLLYFDAADGDADEWTLVGNNSKGYFTFANDRFYINSTNTITGVYDELYMYINISKYGNFTVQFTDAYSPSIAAHGMPVEFAYGKSRLSMAADEYNFIYNNYGLFFRQDSDSKVHWYAPPVGWDDDLGAIDTNYWNVSMFNNATDNPDDAYISYLVRNNNSVYETKTQYVGHVNGTNVVVIPRTYNVKTISFSGAYAFDGDTCPPVGGYFPVAWVYPTEANGSVFTSNQDVWINATCQSADNLVDIWLSKDGEAFFEHNTLSSGSAFNYDSYMLGRGEGDYTFYANCNDTLTDNRTFIYDITAPVIDYNINNSINQDNTSVLYDRSAVYINVNFSDNNIVHAVEMIIVNSSGYVLWNYTNVSVGLDNFIFANYTDLRGWAYGNYAFNITVADAHTAEYITDYKITKDTNEISFITTEKNEFSIRTDTAATIEETKLYDRYSLRVTYDKAIKQKVFYVYSDDRMTYYPDSRYKGHFVFGDLKSNWMDFEGIPGTPTVTKEKDCLLWMFFCGQDYYKVVFNSDVASKEVILNSVGGTNTAKLVMNFSVQNLTMYSVSINPKNATQFDNLEAYCIANHSDSRQFKLNGKWYKENVFFLDSPNISANTENSTFIDYINYLNTTSGQNWTFSCHAETGGYSTPYKNISVQIESIFLDNCSNPSGLPTNQTSLIFKFLSFGSGDVTVNTSATVFTYQIGDFPSEKNFTYGMTNRTNVSICTYPADINIVTNIDMQYLYGTNQFSYFSAGTILNNVTKIVELYIDTGTAITATVYDNINNKVPDAYIRVQRFDYSTGNYVEVGQYKTNFEGITKMYLTKDTVYYRFLIEYPLGSLKLTTSPDYIYSDTIQFKINLYDEVGEKFYDIEGITYSFIYINASQNFRLIYSDASGNIDSACMKITKSTTRSTYEYNNSCLSAASGTIILHIDEDNGTTYTANAFVYMDGVEYFLASLTKSFYALNPLGLMPILGMLLLTIAFAFMFTFSIPIGIMVIPVPLMLGSMFGLVNIEFIYVLGIEIVAVVLAIMVNRRG